LRRKTDPLIGKGGEIKSALALKIQKSFKEAIGDDLNTPMALGVLNEMLKEDLEDFEKASLVLDFDRVLGLNLGQSRLEPLTEVDPSIVKKIEDLLAQRNEARKAKNWSESDKIRDELLKMKVTIQDGPNGTSWSF
jgi:cysteinyl-tRNA synthetase